jgi:FtsP/CotA-like multicopper oxidase with cupredoxin domain
VFVLALVLVTPVLSGCVGVLEEESAASTPDPESPLTPIDRSTEGLDAAQPTRRVDLDDGDSLELAAGYVQHDPGTGTPIRMMAYNGQIPGPEIHVPRNGTITVEFTNELDQPTTVHWHGIRLDNAFDGVPNLTQDPVEPGETFEYQVNTPDAGLFWYHPHVRTDMQKELGLYGALVVEPEREPTEPYPPEDVLMLDDLRLGEDGDVPHMYEEVPTFADSGRWGNHAFVNGTAEETVEIAPDNRHRLHLVNPANARTWRLDFQGFEQVEKVSTGASYLEEPRAIDELRLGPAERAIVDVEVAATDTGRIVDQSTTWTLATVEPTATPTANGLTSTMQAPQSPHEQARSEDRQQVLDAEPDHVVNLLMKREQADNATQAPHGSGDHEHTTPDPPKGIVQAFPTSRDLTWHLKDLDTNQTQPRYEFQVGDVVELNVEIRHAHGGGHGGGHGAHAPVPHPIHLHGQRMLVESYGDETVDELAWKDTFLANDPVRDYQQATVKVELTEPGTWLVHCHISEHSEAGMTAVVDVAPASEER